MDLHYRKVSTIEPVAAYLAEAIIARLKNDKRVLWLVPGGSAVQVAVAASKSIFDANLSLEWLKVSLTDERYGPVGHPDSNALQLQQAGFTLPDPIFKSILDSQDMPTTTQMYADWLKSELAIADYAIGFFGIGPDGHTAGILPNSPAVRSGDFAVGYDGGTYQRITMTPTAIAELDEAVAYATGETKHDVIDSLAGELSLNEQPAQALKQVPKLTIFNDHKGENP